MPEKILIPGFLVDLFFVSFLTHFYASISSLFSNPMNPVILLISRNGLSQQLCVENMASIMFHHPCAGIMLDAGLYEMNAFLCIYFIVSNGMSQVQPTRR